MGVQEIQGGAAARLLVGSGRLAPGRMGCAPASVVLPRKGAK